MPDPPLSKTNESYMGSIYTCIENSNTTPTTLTAAKREEMGCCSTPSSYNNREQSGCEDLPEVEGLVVVGQQKTQEKAAENLIAALLWTWEIGSREERRQEGTHRK